MSYRKYLLRVLLFSIINIFLILSLAAYLNKDYESDVLFDKEYLLKTNPQIIFAGDSRAEMHLDPDVAVAFLDMKNGDVINIAQSSGDILVVNDLAVRFPNKFINATLIVSISANQLNDGAKTPVYFPNSMIAKMNIFEQIQMFIPKNAETLFAYYYSNIEQKIKKILGINLKKPNHKYDNHRGFKINDKMASLERMISKKDINNHPWYQNYNYYGLKHQLIKDALSSLKKRVKRLVVYTGTFAPTYIKNIENTNVWESEVVFQKALFEICKDLDIEFINFVDYSDFEDKLFSDEAHFNYEGAKVFTKILLSKVFN
ncbi:MAG: hypothetical protein AB7U85_07550 [Alphaproteobacteria bacterium]